MITKKMSRILSSSSLLFNCSKVLYQFNHGSKGFAKQLASITRVSHYSSSKDRNSCVVLTKDGSTICCWHPEEAHPYEHSKPIPEIDAEFREGDSVLKVQYRRDAKYRFQPDGPTKAELAKLTYTTKHRWYPRNEKKYLDPNPPKDREGI